MNRKIFYSVAVAWLFVLTVRSQTAPATPEQQKMMLGKIMGASAGMGSMVCDFEQTKELSLLSEKIVSKGKMYYRKNGLLRWEYLTPYRYAFVLNGDKILMQTGNSRNVVDVRSNRFFQELVKVMMSGVNGSGLTDARNFTSSYYAGDRKWKAVLVPVGKEMKQMFASIRLTFSVDDFTVDSVEMEEQNGDKTIIRLTDKKLNAEIDDTQFHID
ncbi:MAG: outer membrane lipoprotein carrier protein LolA [Tannerella sp.]|jgi:outer membrane lipoprotein-sorting protein|nr:outer membrane lipoprotein carrier protein LolA [Tannerella sp.]